MKPTRLPAPEMPLLTPHDEYSLAHLIERHINFVAKDKEGNERSVALDPVFVRHYMKYRDSKLPVVAAIVTSPMVLADGTLLATQGLQSPTRRCLPASTGTSGGPTKAGGMQRKHCRRGHAILDRRMVVRRLD